MNFFLTILIGFLAVADLQAAPAKPMLLLAHFRDVPALQLNADARLGFYHRFAGLPKTAEILADYGTVMVFPSGELEASEAEIQAYLKQGGNVIIVGAAARSLVPRWQGLFGPEATYGRVLGPGTTFADHPLLPKKPAPGVDEEMELLLAPETTASKARAWPEYALTDALDKAVGGEAPIANGTQACLWIKQVGQGKLVFIADVLCPSHLKESHWKYAITSNDTFLERLWDFVGVPRIEEATHVDAPTWWYRDPGKSIEGARTMANPLPAPEEALQRLQIVAGQDEFQRQMVYLSLPATPKSVSVRLPDDAHGLCFGLQDAPTADYRGPLVYVRWLEPGEAITPTAPLLTWWVQVETRGLAPGIHSWTAEILVDGQALPLPIDVTVLPIRLPSHHDFLVEFEFTITNMNVEYGYQDTWPANWQELGLDVLISTMPPFSNLGEKLVTLDGRTLEEAVKAAPEPLRDRLPLIDFTQVNQGRFDLLIQQALAHNLTVFRTYGAMGVPRKGFVTLTQLLYRDASLDEDSPETSAVITAFMRQAGEFLKSKGMRAWYSKQMDEWGPEGMQAFLDMAKPITEAGWAVVGNPNTESVMTKPELREELQPYLHIYWAYANPDALAKLEGTLPPLKHSGGFPSGWMSCLTSSVWWDFPAYYGFHKAWVSAYRRHMGFHLHGWGTRGKYETANVYPLDGYRRLCPSIGMLMVSEAMDVARYGVLLQDMLDTLDPLEAAPFKERWKGIISTDSGSFLTIQKERIAGPDHSLAHYDQARRMLFELLMDVQAKLPVQPPSLTWHEAAIVTNGTSSYSIAAPAELMSPAEELRTGILEVTGVSLPIVEDARSPAIRLATVDEAADRFPQQINAHYPAPGAYLILDGEAGDLWILAREPETFTVAVRNLLNASHLTPRWFTPTTKDSP